MNGSPPAETVAYHVAKDGVISGPYSEAEFRDGVASGRFATGDLVHATGQSEWLPLEQTLEAPKILPASPTSRTSPTPPTPQKVAAGDVPEWRNILQGAWARFRCNLREQGLATGSICLVAGLLALALARWPVVFWAPWLVIAVVAGVVLLRGGRKVTGALLLLAVILLPWMLHRYLSKLPVEKVEPVTQILPAEPLPVEERQPKAPPTQASAGPVPAAPVVVKATPAPLPVPAPAPAPAQTPTVLNAPATPAPESLLTKAGKLAKSVVPYLKKAEDALPKLPDLSKKPASEGTVQPNGDVITPAADQDTSTLLLLKDSIVAAKDGLDVIGNGFICRIGNRTWLFSNTHLIAGSRQPNFVLLNGEMVTPGPIEVAAGPDVLRFPVARAPEHVFEALPDLETAVQIGDGVMVMGNAQGGGVVTSWRGVVTGLGPDRIEVNASFAPTTSGSPIIHLKTGKVIGVATYFRRPYDEFGNDSRVNGTKVGRHFAWRIDKAPAWEPVEVTEFSTEADQLEKISRLTEDIFNFYDSVRSQREPHYGTETLRVAGMEWKKTNRRGLSAADRKHAAETFLNAMHFMVKADVKSLEGHVRYTYFRTQLDSEIKIRERLFQQLEPLLESTIPK